MQQRRLEEGTRFGAKRNLIAGLDGGKLDLV
jgi:hypothetical protein